MPNCLGCLLPERYCCCNGPSEALAALAREIDAHTPADGDD
jgi:hypothetical protein